MALHDLYVNDKDRQELADAALCRDRFLSWGWLGTRGHRPLLANLGLLRPPLPPLGGQLWPCTTSFCTSSELIRNWTTQVRRELVAFHHGFQEWEYHVWLWLRG